MHRASLLGINACMGCDRSNQVIRSGIYYQVSRSLVLAMPKSRAANTSSSDHPDHTSCTSDLCRWNMQAAGVKGSRDATTKHKLCRKHRAMHADALASTHPPAAVGLTAEAGGNKIIGTVKQDG